MNLQINVGFCFSPLIVGLWTWRVVGLLLRLYPQHGRARASLYVRFEPADHSAIYEFDYSYLVMGVAF